MQVYVCVKHVPDSGALIELEGSNAYAEGNVKFVVNPFDEYAIEEALGIVKEKGGEVVVVTMGQASATPTIRAALAMGPTRAIHVVLDEQFNSPAATAKALAAAIKADGQADLVLTGKQSIDSEGMQTLYWLGKEMGMPVVNEVVGLTLGDSSATAVREVGGGQQESIEISMPCVLGATKGLNEPRYPKLPDILKAKKKEVKEVPVADLGVGAAPAPVLEGLELVPERSGAKFIEGGSAAEQAAELVRILKEEAKVI